ncbi:MAG: methionyl-tRNA formyltransferase [Acidobacteriota bacterium]|jgi:methionyl-tRNA formyltransferase|nr:methionyl-tRNA formyltransferase [Acidobacteriota bacterium]
MSVLFLGKQDDSYCEKAQEFIELKFPGATVITGTRQTPLPAEAESWQGDYLLSYLSPWIVPDALLKRARIASINFHPGPPEYPGIGCTNFAIYNNESDFGVTCHHMAPRVDTGKIIAVRRFPLLAADSVYSLTQRCYTQILALFFEMMSGVLAGEELPESTERWTRLPYKRSELNALCRIEPDMTTEEIRRRLRAVTFPGAPGGYVEIGGFRFEYKAT